jgi:tetratricopeptide (TPR) repeat protein
VSASASIPRVALYEFVILLGDPRDGAVLAGLLERALRPAAGARIRISCARPGQLTNVSPFEEWLAERPDQSPADSPGSYRVFVLDSSTVPTRRIRYPTGSFYVGPEEELDDLRCASLRKVKGGSVVNLAQAIIEDFSLGTEGEPPAAALFEPAAVVELDWLQRDLAQVEADRTRASPTPWRPASIDARSEFVFARVAYHARSYETAAAAFGRAVDGGYNDPSNALIWQGNALYRAGKFDGAEQVFELALEQGGREPEAAFGLGLVLDARGRHEAAGKHFEQARLITGQRWRFPDSAAFERAEAAFHLGDYAAAARLYGEVADRARDIRMSSASALMLTGAAPSAEAEFKTLLVETLRDTPAAKRDLKRLPVKSLLAECRRENVQLPSGVARSLAVVLLASGQYSAAQDALDVALEQDDGDARAYLTQSRLLRAVGQPEAAIAALNAASQRDHPQPARVAFLRALAQGDLGQYDDAFVSLDEAEQLALAPRGDIEVGRIVNSARGRILGLKGKPEKGRLACETARALGDKSAATLATLAWLLYAEKRFDEAESIIRWAAELDERDWSIWLIEAAILNAVAELAVDDDRGLADDLALDAVKATRRAWTLLEARRSELRGYYETREQGSAPDQSTAALRDAKEQDLQDHAAHVLLERALAYRQRGEFAKTHNTLRQCRRLATTNSAVAHAETRLRRQPSPVRQSRVPWPVIVLLATILLAGDTELLLGHPKQFSPGAFAALAVGVLVLALALFVLPQLTSLRLGSVEITKVVAVEAVRSLLPRIPPAPPLPLEFQATPGGGGPQPEDRPTDPAKPLGGGGHR